MDVVGTQQTQRHVVVQHAGQLDRIGLERREFGRVDLGERVVGGGEHVVRAVVQHADQVDGRVPLARDGRVEIAEIGVGGKSLRGGLLAHGGGRTATGGQRLLVGVTPGPLHVRNPRHRGRNGGRRGGRRGCGLRVGERGHRGRDGCGDRGEGDGGAEGLQAGVHGSLSRLSGHLPSWRGPWCSMHGLVYVPLRRHSGVDRYGQDRRTPTEIVRNGRRHAQNVLVMEPPRTRTARSPARLPHLP